MANIPETCNDCSYCLPDNKGGVHICNNPDGDYFLVYPNEQTADCPIRDDELDAKRHEVIYRNESFYILITIKDNKPYEIFAEHATSSDPNLYYMMASIDTITRLVTMSLKKYPLKKVVRQINKSSRIKNDMPGILSKLLGEYVDAERN